MAVPRPVGLVGMAVLARASQDGFDFGGQSFAGEDGPGRVRRRIAAIDGDYRKPANTATPAITTFVRERMANDAIPQLLRVFT